MRCGLAFAPVQLPAGEVAELFVKVAGEALGLAVQLSAPFLLAGLVWQVAMGLLAKLVPQGRVVGMDVSDEMIRRARCASVDFENLIFVTGEVEEIPWEPNFFSHVISVESAYYWPDSVAGIREIFRVLKPGGSAWILINYYRDNPHAHQWGGLLAVETHLLSAAEWSERFRAAGFGNVQPERVRDHSRTPEVYTGRWFRDAAELRAFKAEGALLVHGAKEGKA